MDYSLKEFDLVKGGQYSYYKLYIDGVCQFDDFLEEISGDAKYNKWFGAIIAYMEFFSDQVMLRKDKFRPIHETGRDDVFEFKKEKLRVYVIKQKPDMFIILGGYKNNQKKDINLLKQRLKEFEIKGV